MSTTKAPVTFITGYSPRKGVVGISALPDSDGVDEHLSRIFTYDNGTWGLFKDEYPFVPRSITYLTNPEGSYKAWWLVGRNGETVEIRKGVATVGEIHGAGTRKWRPIYGYIESIKCIDGALYACGGGRQVYKRNAESWDSISTDILTEERGRGFFDLDGTDATNIYAVGFEGEIWFYDGKWHLDDSPASSILTSVRVLDRNDVWICGNGGTVLRGRFNNWSTLRASDGKANYYSLESYGGTIFLAANRGLAYIDGDTIRPVDMGLGKAVSTHRLSARDGLLWSIGEKDLVVFDGNSWTEVLHPDNN